MSSLSLSLLSRVFLPWSRRFWKIITKKVLIFSKRLPFLWFFYPSAFSQYRIATYPQSYHLWVKLPSQRFSRSQGFFPSHICRSYFIPVPPLGFFPSGFFHIQRVMLFQAFLPSCGFSESSRCCFLLQSPVNPWVLFTFPCWSFYETTPSFFRSTSGLFSLSCLSFLSLVFITGERNPLGLFPP
jgi:hypothetical protein